MTDTTKTEALPYNPWRESLENCITGDNYLRTAEYDDLLQELDRLYSIVAERDRLRKHLQFVERWAVHHGTKPHMTAEQALSIIQHYPPISDITKSYSDGKTPDTPNPWAERDRLAAECEALRADAERWRHARQRARYNSIDGAAWLELVGRYPWPIKTLPETADYADAAIDAAMGGKE